MTTAGGARQLIDQIVAWLAGAEDDPGWGRSEWRQLPSVAFVHGVGPRLASRLCGRAWVDPAVGTWLEHDLRLNRARIERLKDEAEVILGEAARRGVRMMPMKGLALLPDAEEPGLRPMADLDFLVHANQLGAADEILVALGYHCHAAKAKHVEYLGPDGRRVVSRDHEHPDNPRPVEIHGRCGERFGRSVIDLTELMWSSAREGQFRGHPVVYPDPGVLWLHFLVHTAWQFLFGGGRLIQLFDLADLAPRGKVGEQLSQVDARVALLALDLLGRTIPGALDPQFVEALRQQAGPSAAALAASVDLVGSSHLGAEKIGKASRLLKLHAGSAGDLLATLGYIFLPAVGELHVNHDRVPQSWLRWPAYPLLWAWHVANLTMRG